MTVRLSVPSWRPSVFECPAGCVAGTRVFTVDLRERKLAELELGPDHDPAALAALFTHPLEGGMLVRAPAVTEGPGDDELDAAVAASVDVLRANDPLAFGDQSSVIAYCPHVRSPATLELGLATPGVRAELRAHPAGWLIVAVMPSLRMRR